LKHIAVKGLITAVLVVLAGWLMIHNWHYRAIFHKDYAFEDSELDKYRHIPDALYAIGSHAWLNNDTRLATRFFIRAVKQNVFDMDAWLKLAQAEIVLGDEDAARNILQFSRNLTGNIYRWKWDQILLANELGMEKIVFGNINFLIQHRKKLQDAFQLLDAHLDRNVMWSINVLDTENLIPFMEWLMRWDRVDDARIAWDKIIEDGIHDKTIRSRYIHFLVSKKQVERAAEIRVLGGGNVEGMTNAGFEKEITGRGFDWRFTPDKKNQWTIRRTLAGNFSGEHCLKITFEGKENISFGHLYQIVPVAPKTRYRLTYRWRSRNITTDQGPFVDIYGYDCKGFYTQGPMMFDTHQWGTQNVEFETPEDCHAVVVRLHRRPSRRFDNKIAGKLWLDEFKLEKITSSTQ
jgi:hypothetical protein